MQTLKLIKHQYIKYLFLILIIILPWTFYNADNNVSAEKITSDLSFYEINTCNVTLSSFLLNNTNTIYQNHYKFEANSYSSIRCFGKITGVSQIGHDFVISVGTNSFLNLLFQGLFWTIIFGLIKKPNKDFVPSKLKHYSAVLFTCIILCYLISTEPRYYEKTLYFLNLDNTRSYLLLFLIFLFVSLNLIEVLNRRFYKLVHFLPISFLIIGTFAGFNINIYFISYICYCILSIFYEAINKKILLVLSILTFAWTINGIGGNFSLKPDKIRGFTSSFYDYDVVIAWSIIFFLCLFGMYYLTISTKNYVNFQDFKKNFLASTIPILIFGYLGANAPGLNFFSFYYFGQQKVTTTQINPLAFNEWNEKLAWRGFSSSAESIGEFFGLAVLFCIFAMISSKKLDLINTLFLFVSSVGLYFSNNRASFLMCIFGIAIYFNSKLNIKNSIKAIIFLAFLVAAVLFIGIDNFTYVYSYQSVFIQANNYSIEGNSSSFVNLLNEKYFEDIFFTLFFSIFSFIGFIFNRSELWGIFFSRYNPNYFEYLFGSGPINFGQFYGEINIGETSSFLMPHSSFLSLFIFFGLIGTFGLLTWFIFKLFQARNRNSIYGFIFLLFIFVNLIKSDSLNYLNSLMLYSFITIQTFQKDKRFFKFEV